MKTGDTHKQSMILQTIFSFQIFFKYKLFFLFKYSGEIKSKMICSTKMVVVFTFYNYRNNIFGGRPISRLGEHSFVFMFVIFSSLAALFALVTA